MATITRFEELDAWQTARDLANLVYDLSDDDPFSSDFELRDQIRRASVSVMSNIAEGFNSRTQKIFIDLLGRARGSAAEVQSQLYLARDRGYISQEGFDEAYDLADTASRQTHGLIRYLKSRPNASRVQEGHIRYEIDLRSG
ncbi:MAG: four helix bundle protein [Salinibacter sp.]